jgi:hypothetical protein
LLTEFVMTNFHDVDDKQRLSLRAQVRFIISFADIMNLREMTN